MKKYEVTYLTVAEENHNAGTVSDILAANDAKIVSVNLWSGRRKLAYPIKKQDQAFYTTVVFEAEPSAVQTIERAFTLKDEVLRSLVVVYVPGYFERIAAGEDVRDEGKGHKAEVKSESTSAEAVTKAPAEEPTEEAEEPIEVVAEATETPASEETSEEVKEEKPKRARAKKAEPIDEKVLDEKIDELLNEDITK